MLHCHPLNFITNPSWTPEGMQEYFEQVGGVFCHYLSFLETFYCYTIFHYVHLFWTIHPADIHDFIHPELLILVNRWDGLIIKVLHIQLLTLVPEFNPGTIIHRYFLVSFIYMSLQRKTKTSSPAILETTSCLKLNIFLIGHSSNLR